MSTFQAVYYRTPDGSEPVSDFIDRLTIKRQVAMDNQIDRLNMLGPDFPHLPFPHSSQVSVSFESCGATSGGSTTGSCTAARAT
jgi:hypothetical protein